VFEVANLINPKFKNRVMADQEQDVRNFHEKVGM